MTQTTNNCFLYLLPSLSSSEVTDFSRIKIFCLSSLSSTEATDFNRSNIFSLTSLTITKRTKNEITHLNTADFQLNKIFPSLVNLADIIFATFIFLAQISFLSVGKTRRKQLKRIDLCVKNN